MYCTHRKNRNTMCCGFLAEKECGQSYPRGNLPRMQNHPLREIHTISKNSCICLQFLRPIAGLSLHPAPSELV